MKTALVILLASLSFSAYANDEAELQAGTRYNCFYQDSASGNTYGAVEKTLNRAKGTARRYCEEFLNRNDLPGVCTFIGCRTINTFEVDQ